MIRAALTSKVPIDRRLPRLLDRLADRRVNLVLEPLCKTLLACLRLGRLQACLVPFTLELRNSTFVLRAWDS